MQPSSIFLIYVQPRQKKLIISHKLTIGENFKLLNDINILQEEICENAPQSFPNHCVAWLLSFLVEHTQ
jgi:hypothetical protein